MIATEYRQMRAVALSVNFTRAVGVSNRLSLKRRPEEHLASQISAVQCSSVQLFDLQRIQKVQLELFSLQEDL